jgi:hypothetical protein
MGFDFADFPKQFVLSRTRLGGVAGARTADFAGWTAHAARAVPRIALTGPDGGQTGLLLGWVIHDGRLLADGEALVDGGDFEADVFPVLAGRFIALWQAPAGLRFRLDAAGFLPAVFDAEAGIIASTSTLIDRLVPREIDAAVEAVFAFPRRRGFLPFGLTRHRGVRRLLPGHHLDPETFAVARVWPEADLLAAARMDAAAAARAAAEVGTWVRAQVGAVIRAGRGGIYLSGGRDSRMILAACRDWRAEITCETLINDAPLDRHIATQLARRFGFRHELIEVTPASRAEVAAWLERSGHMVYDAVSELAATAPRIDRGHPVMDGTGAEITRASNWTETDVTAPRLDLATLLERLRLPAAPVFRAAAEAWLAGLPPADAAQALDIAKIEAIHSCWSGSAVYGHAVETPSISPFVSQRINEVALKLPKDYKMSAGFYRDYVASLWPELLEVPVNAATGLDRLRFPREEIRRMVPKTLRRRLKPFR